MKQEQIHIHSFNNSWGTIHIATTDRGVALVTLPSDRSVYFEETLIHVFPKAEIVSGGTLGKSTEKQLQSYFKGKLTTFDLPLDLRCSSFYEKALREVARIPYGQTRSYGEIAARIGHPGASRAVGTANARNPIPIIIPCHRVVASNGLGGYGGGLPMKERLLRLEGAL